MFITIYFAILFDDRFILALGGHTVISRHAYYRFECILLWCFPIITRYVKPYPLIQIFVNFLLVLVPWFLFILSQTFHSALQHLGESNKRVLGVLMENNLQTIALQYILQVLYCIHNITICHEI